MDILFQFLLYCIVGLSALLGIIALTSWYHVRTNNLIFACIAFFAIFIKAILQIIHIVVQNEAGIIIDGIVIIFLYLTIIKK